MLGISLQIQICFPQIAQGGHISGINFRCCPQFFPGQFVFSLFHIQQSQKLIAFYQTRIHGKYLFQLYNGQIAAVLVTVKQGLIIFFNGLIDGVQLRAVGLYLLQISFRRIILRFQAPAEHPLAQCIRHFSHFIINQSKQISRLNIGFIKTQAFLQGLHCSGQIPYFCFL